MFFSRLQPVSEYRHNRWYLCKVAVIEEEEELRGRPFCSSDPGDRRIADNDGSALILRILP